PVIAEGETFRYQSGVPLDTPFGVMEGSYTLQDESGQPFEAPIAPFTLAVPTLLSAVLSLIHICRRRRSPRS
ncbi:ApaG domain, partial [Aeromonas salmonicida]|uniref:ApaG domain-containing protein n=1 Tax=Aeromonas salmonicida TaxID=645 RepID=UPI003D313032